jgi:threonine dehydrogenase-like Zn-dependent dehydrogenase
MNAVQLLADWAPREGYRVTEDELRSQKARMASQVWRRPRLESITLPDPTPGPGEVVVAVRVCGVCGSDTHCLETDAEGYVRFSGPARFPCVLGHEYAGEVVAVGPGVRALSRGDLVTAEGMLYCGVCEACRKGLFNQCIRLDMVGFSSPGAYADLITVHEKHCWTINPLAERVGSAEVACELASLVEPVGCAFNGMFIAAGGMLPGSHVVVFGCGPIGLGAIALARAAGAATIQAWDYSNPRLAVARQLGADEAIDLGALLAGGGDPAEELRRISAGWGADMVVEAAGAATQTLPWIERGLAPAGKVVYLGRTGERAPVMLDVLVSLASCIVGARGHAGGGVFPHILRLLAHDRLPIREMVSCRLPLSRAASAVERSRDRQDAKILLVAKGGSTT